MGKIAFVFAGQGAQYTGMGKELYENFGSAKEVFDTAEKIRKGTKEQCFEGSKETLSITLNTQPCLFAVDLACAKVLNEKGIFADGAAGFSLGEIPAVCYSGILSVEDAFRFVIERAEAMQKCAEDTKGAMFAVLKLPARSVEEICKGIEGTYPVNYNCEGQTVVACKESVSDILAEKVTLAGGKALKLSVSGAFHSPFMQKASEEIEHYLANINFQKSLIPLYANVTAKGYDNAKELLTKQVKSPVMWQKTIENMIADGFDVFIEVGAGKTLSGLIKKISNDVKLYNVEDLKSLETTLNSLDGGRYA